MLNHSRHHNKLARIDSYVPVSELHDHLTFCHHEQLILVFMMMPVELSRELHEFNVEPVDFPRDLRAPVISKLGEPRGQVDKGAAG